jgi:hypothetical protein
MQFSIIFSKINHLIMQLIIMIHFLLLNSRVDVENAITLKFGECIAKEVVLVV